MTSDAFPARPLRLRVPAQGEPWSQFVLFLVAVAAVVGFLYMNGPDLLRDARMLEGTVAAKQARLVEGRCRSKLFLHWCDARIEHRAGLQTITTNQTFMFADIHFGGYRTSIRQSRADATVVTTELALDSFWNRVVTLGVFVVLFGGAGLVTFRSFLRELAANRRFAHLDGQALRPLVVQVFGAEDLGRRGKRWHYGPLGATKPAAVLRLPAKLQPFFLDERSGRALAASDGRGEPLLLDDGLSLLRLERAEHEAMQVWRQRQRTSVPPVGPGPIEQPA
jgi:hypothetical protein